MPAFVKHEASWEKARRIVDKQYGTPESLGDGYWKRVTSIYRNMEPDDFFLKSSEGQDKKAFYLQLCKKAEQQEIIDVLQDDNGEDVTVVNTSDTPEQQMYLNEQDPLDANATPHLHGGVIFKRPGKPTGKPAKK